MKTSLLLGTAFAIVFASGVASAAKTSFIAADMDGAKEKPTAVNTAVTGEARFTYDDVTKKFCGHIKIVPSTFVATASHLHIGDANTAGAVGIALDGFTGDLSVNRVLTADEAKVLEGDVYLNVHSAANPGGEIRDQLVEDGDTTAPDEVCEGDEPEADAGSDAGNAGSDAGSSGAVEDAGAIDIKGDAGSSPVGKTSTSQTPASTDGGGCNTTGSSDVGTGFALAAGLGLALTMAARKRKKRS